ncbi:glycosyltransferase family 1 protein [Anabaena sp. UHCC 0399]|uniref:glycosyltransferase family 4 protein n=1 Tax=Anabaena sp. UHCC 0399 TaxID=3110238 RepID=UPI002B1FD5B9|nr:glycosyltransferase family 1 protein [Anabaena sp. UHCC 0399]MEA5566422.1 glycosyltransferase family 1 protein [Anabaena sp. UHCC 0399]
MLKLAYDYQVFSWAKYGGISRYIYEIASRTADVNDFEVKIFPGLYVNEYIKKCDSELVKGLKVPFIPKAAKILSAINFQISNICMTNYMPHVVHETYYSYRSIAPSKSKKVVTVYDMLHEKFGHTMNKKDRDFTVIKAEAIKRADCVICISENTKNDLLELLDIEAEKIFTIYLGCSLQNNSFKDYSIPIKCPYLLYVGERRLEYKNFKRLLQAYASNESLKENFKLVCFGSRDFSTNEKALINSLKLTEGQVIYIGGDDLVLSSLYSHATALVYPSLYEGFGLPLLEAMSFNCPVVCSNISSIPEVVVDAGEYFDPYQIDSISDALEKVVFDEIKRKELIMKGQERVKNFSWEICAKQTQLVYKSLL